MILPAPRGKDEPAATNGKGRQGERTLGLRQVQDFFAISTGAGERTKLERTAGQHVEVYCGISGHETCYQSSVSSSAQNILLLGSSVYIVWEIVIH